MSGARVSVLMAVHNEGEYLAATLASLQHQTLHDWELVVVDDGSDDATPEILAEVARRDPRVQVVSPGKIGLVAALNLGLERCHAPLLARMDGDDICHPQRFKRQLETMTHAPDLDLLATRIRHFPRPSLSDGMRAYEEWLNSHLEHDEIARDVFVESPFANPSVMLRTAKLRDLGGYIDYGWPEDYDLWLRYAASGARFARLPETLLFWRDHPDRLTRTSPAFTLQAFRTCRAHYLRQAYLAGHDSVTLWGAGKEGKAWRKTLENIGIRVSRWVEIDRRKIGQRIHSAPVVSFDALAPGQGPMLITIGARAARPQVREFAAARGLREGHDFICVT
ncbi:MAG: glycosyl transferase [Desulfuromonas sp.]|nr:MAG: glycosyl transferase [Desulfuromonas sp.]